jgi:hypothetical protein
MRVPLALVALVVFLAGCTAQVNETSVKIDENAEEKVTPELVEEAPQPFSEGTLQGEVSSPEERPPQLPTTKELSIETDDNGFYISNTDISSVAVSKGDITKITFTVRKEGTYYGGLDFRGCGQDTLNTAPGDSVAIQFTAENTCTITSYWPSSGVVKDSMQVIVS